MTKRRGQADIVRRTKKQELGTKAPRFLSAPVIPLLFFIGLITALGMAALVPPLSHTLASLLGAQTELPRPESTAAMSDAVVSQLVARAEKNTPVRDPYLVKTSSGWRWSAGHPGLRADIAATARRLQKGETGTVFEVVEPLPFPENASLPSVASLAIVFEGKTWEVSSETISSWFVISGAEARSRFLSPRGFRAFVLAPRPKLSSKLNSEAVAAYVQSLNGAVARSPVNARLTIQEGRATVFQPSSSGREVDAAETARRIEAALTGSSASVALAVRDLPAEVREENLNNLGIRELIASGITNFAGSPQNRRVNISVGASKFNGVLIRPGENFSFNTALGPVEASTGFLPELVILRDKTVPEYGGGLCQVSSTIFRAALNAGLPITARLSHAYPVVYYKPYGVDATIYPPNPDLKFVNDTGAYILVQTFITGNELHFDFYGTKPKRTVKFSGTDNGGNVERVENVTPYLWDQDVRGPRSFSAQFYRFVYNADGSLASKNKWVSLYDTPDKYPRS